MPPPKKNKIGKADTDAAAAREAEEVDYTKKRIRRGLEGKAEQFIKSSANEYLEKLPNRKFTKLATSSTPPSPFEQATVGRWKEGVCLIKKNTTLK